MPPSVMYIFFPVAHIPGRCPLDFPKDAKDADWIERRVRMMSSGYVNVTDDMPAIPPQKSLFTGVRSPPGDPSKN